MKISKYSISTTLVDGVAGHFHKAIRQSTAACSCPSHNNPSSISSSSVLD